MLNPATESDGPAAEPAAAPAVVHRRRQHPGRALLHRRRLRPGAVAGGHPAPFQPLGRERSSRRGGDEWPAPREPVAGRHPGVRLSVAAVDAEQPAGAPSSDLEPRYVRGAALPGVVSDRPAVAVRRVERPPATRGRAPGPRGRAPADWRRRHVPLPPAPWSGATRRVVRRAHVPPESVHGGVAGASAVRGVLLAALAAVVGRSQSSRRRSGQRGAARRP